MKSSAIILLSAAAVAQAQVGLWGQCGGIGYSGSTSCVAGAYCSTMNPYYAQCLSGGPTTTTTTTRSTTAIISTVSLRTTTSSSRTSPTTTPDHTTTRSTTTSISLISLHTSPSPTSRWITTTTTTTTSVGTGVVSPPGATLIPPYLWIRAVVPPYYHKYLQSQQLRSVGNAVLGSPSTAGQFNIVDGQLVQLIGTNGSVLYGKIEERADSSVNKLLLTWTTSPSSYGTFLWNGDALIWRNPSISRQNEAAWLICDNAKVYANLGAYGYMTPSGCSDATIHYYNGATAVE